MILSCNSCEKKFVVPDNAIGSEGRLVQCSSCGNKWKQFPPKKEKANKPVQFQKKQKIEKKAAKNIIKKAKRKIKKRPGPDLYSPEYLAKKHGIKISDASHSENKEKKISTKISFGFYNYLIVYIVLLIFVLRMLFFAQDIIIKKIPISEMYLRYVFETLNNITEIFFNFFIG